MQKRIINTIKKVGIIAFVTGCSVFLIFLAGVIALIYTALGN